MWSRRKKRDSTNALQQRAERYQVGLPSWQSSSGRGSIGNLPGIKQAVHELRKAHQAAGEQDGAQNDTHDAARRRIHLNI